MKKFFIVFTTMLCLLFGNTEVFAQKGNFKKAVKLHNSAAQNMQKKGADDAKTLDLYTKAIAEYQKCVNMTDPNTGEANRKLGGILYDGPKSLRNYEQALQYLYNAVGIYKKENKSADFLATCYREIGTAHYRMEDFYSAFVNWQRASEVIKNFAGDVACMYWMGLGVEQDLPKAMELYKETAILGQDLWVNIYALDYHTKEYEKGNFDNKGIELYLDYLHLRNLGEDKSVWMPKLEQSANLNCPPALYEYWVYCRNDKAFSKGMPYLQKGVDAGYVPAFCEMGFAYYMGADVVNNKWNVKSRNLNEAAKWFLKAANEGYPLAQNNLGIMYFYNNIVADGGYGNNKEMTEFWWNTAAEQGYAPAIQYKQLIQNYLTPQQRNALNAQLILNSIQSIISTSQNIYNTVNKNKIQTYTPPNNRTQQTTNTSSSSSSGVNCAGLQLQYNKVKEYLADDVKKRQSMLDNGQYATATMMAKTISEWNSQLRELEADLRKNGCK